jgi:enoyl-[acyl-carrier protein] reductase I
VLTGGGEGVGCAPVANLHISRARMSNGKGLMAGKKGLIMGVANDRSIAWGIAKAVADQGGELAFTYQGDALLRRVKPLAEQAGSKFLLPCDVSDDKSLDAVFGTLEKEWGSIDFLVHAIAFSNKDELKGKYLNTTKQNFTDTMLVSCYSFTEVCRRAAPLMTDGGSFLTLTYFGAERVMPHYNVMGVAKAALEASVKYLAVDLGDRNIRVNAVSAGPIRTLAASGIGDFRYILKWNEFNAPLRRNVTIEEVGGAGLYLLSDLSGGVTGEIHHVDSGYNIIGMKSVDAPDLTVEKSE